VTDVATDYLVNLCFLPREDLADLAVGQTSCMKSGCRGATQIMEMQIACIGEGQLEGFAE